MNSSEVSNSSRRPLIRSSTSASTVASRAVVGSSRISRDGSEASAMAITTRWSMPPESWCGYRPITPFGSEMRTLVRISCARSSAGLRSSPAIS